MIEVHPPEGPMHGIRDFLLHIFTITIGLLIALALEAGVEKIHQHHLRDEADLNLHQELRNNEHELQVTRDAVVNEKKSLIAFLDFLQARSEGKKYNIENITLDFTSGTFSDASWRTATATGSLGLMEYDQVQLFAQAYQVQELFSRLDEQTLDEYLQLESYVAHGFDPNKMSVEDAKTAAGDVRKTLAHVEALDEVGQGLKKAYDQVLK